MLDWKDFVEFYEIFVSYEKGESYAIKHYPYLTHFLIFWSSLRKHQFVLLVGPKQTPSNAWRLGPCIKTKSRAKVIIPYQENVFKHVPLCIKVRPLANFFAIHLNVPKK